MQDRSVEDSSSEANEEQADGRSRLLPVLQKEISDLKERLDHFKPAQDTKSTASTPNEDQTSMDNTTLQISLMREEVAYLKETLKNQAMKELKQLHKNFDYLEMQTNIAKEAVSRCVQRHDLQELHQKFDHYVTSTQYDHLMDELASRVHKDDLIRYDLRMDAFDERMSQCIKQE